jgi:hypothetical protein
MKHLPNIHQKVLSSNPGTKKKKESNRSSEIISPKDTTEAKDMAAPLQELMSSKITIPAL